MTFETWPTNVTTYYPGAAERQAALKQHCPDAVSIAHLGNLQFVPDLDAPGGGGDYLCKTEIFAPGLGIKYIDGSNDSAAFLAQAVDFANTKCFGSLSCTVVIDPRTVKHMSASTLDSQLRRLEWGTIGINIWAAMGANNPYGTWGAPPNRHNDADIQSGKGLMGNCLWVQNVRKTVLRGAWCDPMLHMVLMPSSKSPAIARSFANLLCRQSVGALVRLVGSIAVGK